MAIRAGYIGQIKGPFGLGENILAKMLVPTGYQVRIGISMSPYDLMPIPEWYFELNGRHIKLGKTAIYESDSPFVIDSLFFPLGAPSSTIVEYVVYN